MCYHLHTMKPIDARYEDGVLRPTHPLPLQPGERVGVIVVRRADPSRWDLEKLAVSAGAEDAALAEEGLADWSRQLDREDSR